MLKFLLWGSKWWIYYYGRHTPNLLLYRLRTKMKNKDQERCEKWNPIASEFVSCGGQRTDRPVSVRDAIQRYGVHATRREHEFSWQQVGLFLMWEVVLLSTLFVHIYNDLNWMMNNEWRYHIFISQMKQKHPVKKSSFAQEMGSWTSNIIKGKKP